MPAEPGQAASNSWDQPAAARAPPAFGRCVLAQVSKLRRVRTLLRAGSGASSPTPLPGAWGPAPTWNLAQKEPQARPPPPQPGRPQTGPNRRGRRRVDALKLKTKEQRCWGGEGQAPAVTAAVLGPAGGQGKGAMGQTIRGVKWGWALGTAHRGMAHVGSSWWGPATPRSGTSRSQAGSRGGPRSRRRPSGGRCAGVRMGWGLLAGSSPGVPHSPGFRPVGPGSRWGPQWR